MGNHGWDNTLPSMQAIFMARGPLFNEQVQIESLNNVDIYHIACRILDLKPNPYATAGSLANLSRIFRVTDGTSTPSNHGLSLDCRGSYFLSLLISFILTKK